MTNDPNWAQQGGPSDPGQQGQQGQQGQPGQPYGQPGQPYGQPGQPYGQPGFGASPAPAGGQPGYGSYGAPPAAPQYYAPPYQAPTAGVVTPHTSGLAVASFILSLVGFFCVPIVGSFIGVILGFMARGQIKRSPGTVTGGGLAMAGIIIGIIAFVGWAAFWILLLAFGHVSTTSS